MSDEYIKRETVLADELTYCLPHSVGKAAGKVVVFAEDIEAIPAADVAPVVHGHWSIRCETHHDTHTGEVDEEFYLECSECKRKVWDVSQDAIIMGDYRKAIADFPYCHCGARMDGDGNG